jgi:hypothetical protein
MPFSLMSVVVEDGDVDLGTVGETPKVAVAGRVAFRAMSGTASYSGELPGQILAGFATGGVARRSAPGDDGAFAFEWVPPGVFEFRVDPEDVQEGWRLASDRSGGRDVLLDGVEVGGAAVPLEVVYANDGVRIEGVVRRPDGALLPGAHVVLVPPANRRGPFAQFPTAAAGSSGGFLLEDVPPGSYRLLALDLMGNPDAYPFWQSPDFLRRDEFRGERSTVDPGTRLTINPEAIPLVE